MVSNGFDVEGWSIVLEVSTSQRKVTIGGAEIQVGARAFDVLAFLFEHADRVVSKEELLNQVWSGLLVEESNLTVQIAGLRKQLGREWIKTVPGVGYKLTLAEVADTSAEATPTAPAPPVPSIPSLAVLPFANLSGSQDWDYLVEGIANEINVALSRVASFLVVSNTSTFGYKGRAVDLAEVGRELGVRYLLEGSVQKYETNLRISTQLVEATSGRMIWQERFEGSTSEIFDLQDRIAECVAGALEPSLLWAEAARAKTKPTENLKAYDLCLQATGFVLRPTTVEMTEKGLALLRQALELDPNYTTAKGMICYAHSYAFGSRWWSFKQASAVLDLAYEVLAANSPDPLALGLAGHHIAYIGHEHQIGLTALQRAMTLNPNSSIIVVMLGYTLTYMGRVDEALVHLERAKRLSPVHPQIGVVTAGIANISLQKGDFARAAELYDQSLAESPEFASSHMGQLASYWSLKRYDDAKRLADVIRRKIPDLTISRFRKTNLYDEGTYISVVVEAMKGTGFPD
jgi:TolB-like protein